MIKMIAFDWVLIWAECWPATTFTNVYRNETSPIGELSTTLNDVIMNGSVSIPDEVASFAAGPCLTSLLFVNNWEHEPLEEFLT